MVYFLLHTQLINMSDICIICGSFNGYPIDGNLSYHKFPNNADEWLELFHLNSESVNFNLHRARLCSRHFTPDDFSRFENDQKNRRLKKNARPTVFFVDESFYVQRKKYLCKSGVLGNDSLNTIAASEKKYTYSGRTCLICRRQKGQNLIYFSFPRGRLRNAWLNVCSRTDPIPKNARLCSRHFEHYHFANPPEANGRTTLKRNAIPTLFLPKSTSSSKRDDSVISETGKISEDSPLAEKRISVGDSFVIKNEVLLESLEMEDNTPVPCKKSELPSTSFTRCRDVPLLSNQGHDERGLLDHSYSVQPTSISTPKKSRTIRYTGDISTQDLAIPTRVKKNFLFMKRVILKQRREIYNLRKKVNRNQDKVKNLLHALQVLKKTNILKDAMQIN